MSSPTVAPADGDPLSALALARLAAGTHRRWDGRRYVLDVPAELAGRLRRIYVRRVLWLEAVADPAPDHDRRLHFTRAGGDCVCDQCGEVYYDHPADLFDDGHCLTVLCDRSRVKL